MLDACRKTREFSLGLLGAGYAPEASTIPMVVRAEIDGQVVLAFNEAGGMEERTRGHDEIDLAILQYSIHL